MFVEHRGVEPLTSTMRMSRATNCANAPCASGSISQNGRKGKMNFLGRKEDIGIIMKENKLKAAK